jgi:hypothetical protein
MDLSDVGVIDPGIYVAGMLHASSPIIATMGTVTVPAKVRV